MYIGLSKHRRAYADTREGLKKWCCRRKKEQERAAVRRESSSCFEGTTVIVKVRYVRRFNERSRYQ